MSLGCRLTLTQTGLNSLVRRSPRRQSANPTRTCVRLPHRGGSKKNRRHVCDLGVSDCKIKVRESSLRNPMALRSCDQNIQSVKKKSRVYVEIRMHDYNRMLNSDTFFIPRQEERRCYLQNNPDFGTEWLHTAGRRRTPPP